jgi:hypothetical protein
MTERLEAMLRPLDPVSFSTATEALTGRKVLAFDPDNPDEVGFLANLKAAAGGAASRARSEGIVAGRPNEAGNAIEPVVIDALKKHGFAAGTPRCRSGRMRSAGYPDIRVYDGHRTAYIDCKTYSKRTKDQTLRTFYLSPSSDPKITDDAFHFLMSFELEQTDSGVFLPVRWGIYELARLNLHLKFEFNASNRNLYTKDSLLASGAFQSADSVGP